MTPDLDKMADAACQPGGPSRMTNAQARAFARAVAAAVYADSLELVDEMMTMDAAEGGSERLLLLRNDMCKMIEDRMNALAPRQEEAK